MKKLITFLICFMLLITGCGASESPESKMAISQQSGIAESGSTSSDEDLTSVEVARVIDGDTIEVIYNGQSEKARLIGVDTPETVHPNKEVEPYGKEASDYTKSQLEGKTVNLELDVEERDKYGRLLAYVWVGDKLFNETLVSEGYAQVSTYPPNVKYVDRFAQAQTSARDNNRGLWGIQEEENPISTSAAATTPEAVTPTPVPIPTTIETRPQVEPQTITVYVTNTGSKYHRGGCRYLSKSKIPIELNSAKASGYGPCSVCNPPR